MRIAAGSGLTTLVDDLRDKHRSCLFLSPHPDDAVYSAGALMAALTPACPVVVVTVFTDASPPPWPRAARNHLDRLGFTDARALFAARNLEDQAVLSTMGIRSRRLGFIDAPFRRRPAAPNWIARLLPELAAAYPTYRFDAARGRISRADRSLRRQLQEELSTAARATAADLVFAPLGVGNHVDHLLVRDAVSRLTTSVVYYSDFPYSEANIPNRRFVTERGLVPFLWMRGRLENAARITGYHSQFATSFPTGRVPLRPEVYWLPPD